MEKYLSHGLIESRSDLMNMIKNLRISFNILIKFIKDLRGLRQSIIR